MEYIPYTYLIGWTSIDKWYYGVEYAKNEKKTANPQNLWKTYFTSSNYVEEMRKEYGDPDIIQVRKTFDCPKKALEWELKVLKKMNVITNKKFINKHTGNKFESQKGIPKPESMKRKTSERMLGNTVWSGRKHKEETKVKIKNSNKNKLRSVETKRKCSESAKMRSAELVALHVFHLRKNAHKILKPLEYNGITYFGYKDLHKQTGLSRYLYKKYQQSKSVDC
jgi:hypothetical protein